MSLPGNQSSLRRAAPALPEAHTDYAKAKKGEGGGFRHSGND
jgi:hypothetical protein